MRRVAQGADPYRHALLDHRLGQRQRVDDPAARLGGVVTSATRGGRTARLALLTGRHRPGSRRRSRSRRRPGDARAAVSVTMQPASTSRSRWRGVALGVAARCRGRRRRPADRRRPSPTRARGRQRRRPGPGARRSPRTTSRMIAATLGVARAARAAARSVPPGRSSGAAGRGCTPPRRGRGTGATRPGRAAPSPCVSGVLEWTSPERPPQDHQRLVAEAAAGEEPAHRGPPGREAPADLLHRRSQRPCGVRRRDAEQAQRGHHAGFQRAGDHHTAEVRAARPPGR